MSKSKKAAGEVRQSQVLSTYGPGSMVDLPNHAVLIGGLNHWQGYKNQPIYEDRLASRLADILGVSRVAMYAPPAQETEPQAPRTGVKAFVFPTWFVAQKSAIYRFQGREYQSRALLPHDRYKGIKQVELEAFLASDDEVGGDVPDGDFHARTRQLAGLPEALDARIDRIVLVHRLREVIAQVGFTRFEPELPDIDGDLSLGVRRAALSLENNWLPAIENRGEGVLISFQAAAIQDWLTKTEVKARGKELVAGFHQWLGRRGLHPDEVKFPGLPYIMLHSLSHLLITSISLECGYAASSIRERIYAGDYGYGILLYTGSSSSEGTLGGLVQIGERIEHHLISALEYGKLCSNDPVCSQHKPENAQVERFLHGSACHSCLLIAEPSCERRNEFLVGEASLKENRDLVVNTLNSSGAAFFPVGVGEAFALAKASPVENRLD